MNRLLLQCLVTTILVYKGKGFKTTLNSLEIENKEIKRYKFIENYDSWRLEMFN